ncbi:MAG: acetyl-CoA carboxylase, carboxyltransferase subunit beta [Pseudomonadota bacterium]
MNWITNVVRPKINSFLRREMPDNKWVKDPESGQMVYLRDLEANQFVVPGSGYHMRMGGEARLKSLFDNGEFTSISFPQVASDPLNFRDEKKYSEKIKQARSKTGRDDAILAGEGTLDGLQIVAAVQDFDFMGGSLGMAAGEAIITAMRRAVKLRAPFIFFVASGGARMQEGVLSLMQMPRTTVAVQELREARLPYIVVLTNPTTGGVTASYAMLGDIHIAEPGAMIGFAGQRVIEQTIREKLPEGFQKSEYLLEHGMVDMVVHRHDLRDTLSQVTRLLMRSPAVESVSQASEDAAAPAAAGAEVIEGAFGAGEEVAAEAEANVETLPEHEEELKAAERTALEPKKAKSKKQKKKSGKSVADAAGEWADDILGDGAAKPSVT